ncbi:MAG: hypothetical protein JWM11_2604, partial [Planctomycetaceae bacterium]|nr:hypothetical protein [Planctomycetaceae bacterium]
AATPSGVEMPGEFKPGVSLRVY